MVAGQTWHWVDPVAGAAKAARVLRPDGRLAVFWNVFQPPYDLAETFADVYRRVLPDSPFSREHPVAVPTSIAQPHRFDRRIDRRGVWRTSGLANRKARLDDIIYGWVAVSFRQALWMGETDVCNTPLPKLSRWETV